MADPMLTIGCKRAAIASADRGELHDAARDLVRAAEGEPLTVGKVGVDETATAADERELHRAIEKVWRS
jgi:hypothetical protein